MDRVCLANIITFCRIPLAICLLFLPPFSAGYMAIYLIGGITDMVDGTIARRTGTESTFGSRMDSLADLVFLVLALVTIVPAVDIPTWLWVWAAIIVAIKVINAISGLVITGRIVVEHTVMNKVTGMLLFLLPFALLLVDLEYSAIPVCIAATLAAIQEGHYIRTGVEKHRSSLQISTKVHVKSTVE